MAAAQRDAFREFLEFAVWPHVTGSWGATVYLNRADVAELAQLLGRPVPEEVSS